MEGLLRGSITIPPPIVQRSLAEVRGFIAKRRSAIEAELAQPAQPWNFTLRRSVTTENIGRAKASFATTWTTNFFGPRADKGTAQVELDLYGRHYSGTFTELMAGPDMRNPRNVGIVLSGTFPGVSVPIHLAISTPSPLFKENTSQELKTWETGATLLAGHFEQEDFRIMGFSSTGTLRLNQTGKKEGASVTGEIEGKIAFLPWEDVDLKDLKPVPAAKK